MSYNENVLKKYHSKITSLSKTATKNDTINPVLYEKYDVKRGLRDLNGNGVVCGLTEISEINSFKRNEKGEKLPCVGELFYRGINIKDIVNSCYKDSRFGFEETIYLLLFGVLPTKHQLVDFCEMLADFRSLPTKFVRDIIMKAPSSDMMNMLARCVLALYAYDDNANETLPVNVLRQELELISQLPMLAVYSFKAHDYYNNGASLVIHNPRPDLSYAENILYMLRDDNKYTDLEAKVLDLCLILHAEHGGGNNSTFTMRVVTSSDTDTYSAVAASLASLKGPKHGGANIKVVEMFKNIKENVLDLDNDGELKDYLAKMLNKEVFDKSGLIYGLGHAVYSLSDPRAEILKGFAKMLADEKGMQKEFELYERVANFASELVAEKRKIYKGVCVNVDFYSGLVYTMLNLPIDLYTPFFAISRTAGWSAHRIEELTASNKIIRPAYQCVAKRQHYKPINER